MQQQYKFTTDGMTQERLESPGREARRARRNRASMTTRLDPWRLVWGQPYIDARKLARALEEDLAHTPQPDFRTRLLVRDAARALKAYWGPEAFARWLTTSPQAERIGAILEERLGRTGYGNIRRRLVEGIDRGQIEQVFEMIGGGLRHLVEIDVAGSLPTLLEGLTCRPTDDIDVVNEVPAAIRDERTVLDEIWKKFGLKLGHVQSHYLPANWQNRKTLFGNFGNLRVYLANPIDVFVSKLSSKQEKHCDDLRVMAPHLDRIEVKQRLLTDGRAFLEVPRLREQIEANWHFVFREKLD